MQSEQRKTAGLICIASSFGLVVSAAALPNLPLAVRIAIGIVALSDFAVGLYLYTRNR
ncbi:MAG: hypothetical protein RMM17_14140 [Acidobacteriota bacterium]|nr:hypothetical protein [Blastocatellia bacterium]MDW8413809.1 hypothetical protein [Acidobacteriota bacterium]